MTAIVFNPTARGDQATTFRARLNAAAAAAGARGRSLELRPTRSAGDAVVRAREAVAEGANLVVAAGGDGTVNEVANGIAQVSDGPERCRLGVLPLGTVNVFAKELRIPSEFDAAWAVLRQEHEVTVDLAYADALSDGPSDGTLKAAAGRRWFVQMAGAGLDSLALEKVSWPLKKRFGALAYIWAGTQALFSPLPWIEAEIDGQRWRGQWAAIGNGRYYGGRWVVFPDARLDDGTLDLALVQRVSVLGFPFQFGALAAGRFEQARGVIHQPGREVILRPAPGELRTVPFHVEGDNVGRLPARFGMDPRPLRVIAPVPSSR